MIASQPSLMPMFSLSCRSLARVDGQATKAKAFEVSHGVVTSALLLAGSRVAPQKSGRRVEGALFAVRRFTTPVKVESAQLAQ